MPTNYIVEYKESQAPPAPPAPPAAAATTNNNYNAASAAAVGTAAAVGVAAGAAAGAAMAQNSFSAGLADALAARANTMRLESDDESAGNAEEDDDW